MLGDEIFDGDVARHRGKALDQLHVIGDPIGQILVGPDIDADDAAGVGARGEALEHDIGAVRIEAQPVDDAPIGLETKHARPRLPACGRGVMVPTSTKPKPRRKSASGTSAFLSKPDGLPTGLGKFSAKARTASRCHREMPEPRSKFQQPATSEPGRLPDPAPQERPDERRTGRSRCQLRRPPAVDLVGSGHAH